MKKPNVVQTMLAVAACKATRFVLRKTGKGGTAVPGIIAMKLAKNILAAVTDGMEIVVVTGTNGKTTTCNMIEHALTSAGKDCLLNKSGANMLHGMAADLICNATWLGKPKTSCAVLECDEAALKLLVPFFSPKVIVVTNLFSDQVDRYGGVQNTLKEIRAGVEASPVSTLVLNAEDPLSASLSLRVPNQISWFGLDASVGERGKIDLIDAGKCPRCGGEYHFHYHVYAHLGGFSCEKCGYQRQQPLVAVCSIEEMDETGTSLTMKVKNQSHKIRLALPAIYNVYNAAACVAAALAMKVPVETALNSLSSVKSSFGRLETFDLDGNPVQMILVKNPAGCNQAFSYVTSFDKDFSAVLCLNNRTGDGHDFSWIENTDYEKLCTNPHLKKLYVCGDQAKALADRLARAGAADGLPEIVSDYKVLLEKLKADRLPVYALPNYTAMMELRQVLTAATGNKEFWE